MDLDYKEDLIRQVRDYVAAVPCFCDGEWWCWRCNFEYRLGEIDREGTDEQIQIIHHPTKIDVVSSK